VWEVGRFVVRDCSGWVVVEFDKAEGDMFRRRYILRFHPRFLEQ
jgi:hypothetical protein